MGMRETILHTTDLDRMGWLVKHHTNENQIKLSSITYIHSEIEKIALAILSDGFYVGNETLGPSLLELDSSWPSFHSIWRALRTDNYMQDGGQYRKRSYSTMYSHSNDVYKKPYMPLYKSNIYKNFAGNVSRYFDETDPTLYENKHFKSALTLALNTFNLCESKLGNIQPKWFIEIDQYRIVTENGGNGKPTPEGIHSDGTTYFLLMLVDRNNVEGGVSSIYDSEMNSVLTKKLTNPGDVMLINDTHMLHSVSDIKSTWENGNRDILHISFTNLDSMSSVKRRWGLTQPELELFNNLRGGV